MKKTIIQILLLAVIVVLVYLIYESIMEPIRFNREKDKRIEAVVQNLKDIRSSQLAFKSINSMYAPDFDTLIYFIKSGEIPVIKMIPDPEDTTYTRSIMDTIAFINVYDSLFGRRENFNIEDFAIIPFTEGDSFVIDASQIERSKMLIHVFEAFALNDQFLKGLDAQLVNNYNDLLESTERFPGLKVGSLLEATTDGNWE